MTILNLMDYDNQPLEIDWKNGLARHPDSPESTPQALVWEGDEDTPIRANESSILLRAPDGGVKTLMFHPEYKKDLFEVFREAVRRGKQYDSRNEIPEPHRAAHLPDRVRQVITKGLHDLKHMVPEHRGDWSKKGFEPRLDLMRKDSTCSRKYGQIGRIVMWHPWKSGGGDYDYFHINLYAETFSLKGNGGPTQLPYSEFPSFVEFLRTYKAKAWEVNLAHTIVSDFLAQRKAE